MTRQAQHELMTTNKTELRKSMDEQDQIERLAYRHWIDRGRPAGSDQEDWYRAEAEIRGGSRQQQIQQHAA